MHLLERPRWLRYVTWRILCLLLALNYFAFRIELFREENEQNHPQTDLAAHQVTFSMSSLNWETFDKDNAPKAIVVNAGIQIELFGILPAIPKASNHSYQPYQPTRDKSPPV